MPAVVRTSHALGMFVITEADAAAIRAVFNEEGELSAVIELRRRFPGVTDNAKARTCARSIAGWTPLPARFARDRAASPQGQLATRPTAGRHRELGQRLRATAMQKAARSTHDTRRARERRAPLKAAWAECDGLVD